MSKLQTLKFKYKSNRVEIWERDSLIKSLDEAESEDLLIQLIENSYKNKSNIINFNTKIKSKNS